MSDDQKDETDTSNAPDSELSPEADASDEFDDAPEADAADELADDTSDEAALDEPEQDLGPADEAPYSGPSFIFFGVVAAIGLVLDAVTKAWAEITLSELPRRAPSIVLIEDRLTFTLAYNKGGAFGMLSDEADFWRKPFFLMISCVAALFIVSLYRKVGPKQTALRWGLPLVLGGALGNLADRITKGKVVDFIDYRADWVQTMNEIIRSLNDGWHITRHWPTFNVADVCICVGVGLMAVDMFVSSRASSGEGKPAEAPANGA